MPSCVSSDMHLLRHQKITLIAHPFSLTSLTTPSYLPISPDELHLGLNFMNHRSHIILGYGVMAPCCLNILATFPRTHRRANTVERQVNHRSIPSSSMPASLLRIHLLLIGTDTNQNVSLSLPSIQACPWIWLLLSRPLL